MLIATAKDRREDGVKCRLRGKLSQSVCHPHILVATGLLAGADERGTITRGVQIFDEALNRLDQGLATNSLTRLRQHGLGIDQGVVEHVSVDLRRQ